MDSQVIERKKTSKHKENRDSTSRSQTPVWERLCFYGTLFHPHWCLCCLRTALWKQSFAEVLRSQTGVWEREAKEGLMCCIHCGEALLEGFNTLVAISAVSPQINGRCAVQFLNDGIVCLSEDRANTRRAAFQTPVGWIPTEAIVIQPRAQGWHYIWPINCAQAKN